MEQKPMWNYYSCKPFY